MLRACCQCSHGLILQGTTCDPRQRSAAARLGHRATEPAAGADRTDAVHGVGRLGDWGGRGPRERRGEGPGEFGAVPCCCPGAVAAVECGSVGGRLRFHTYGLGGRLMKAGSGKPAGRHTIDENSVLQVRAGRVPADKRAAERACPSTLLTLRHCLGHACAGRGCFCFGSGDTDRPLARPAKPQQRSCRRVRGSGEVHPPMLCDFTTKG